MAISPLPTPIPSRQQPEATFSTNADAFLGALPTFVTEANALATDVNTKATNAANSATASANSATASANSATASANSATSAAAAAATAAADFEAEFAASVAAAAASASEASGYANAADTSAGQAAGSASDAADKYDQFDDRYLGSKAVEPTTDNDGNPLVEGALYWNSSAKNMRVWNGSSWLIAYIPATGYATLNGTETLTNKTINTADNTLVGVKTVNGESLLGTGDVEISSGTKTFIASGTISTGQTVAITADGKAEIVKLVSTSSGTPVVFESANTGYISCCYDSANGKVVIAYTDNGNSGYGTAIVGTVSGTSISFGSPAVFESANTGYISCCYDSANGKMVIAYQDAGNSGYGTAIVGTVSGTSISFGSPVVFESANTDYVSCCYDSTNGKVVIAYRDAGNSYYGTAIVGTVSGTSISFGSPVVFESANTDYVSCCYDSTNGKVVIAYRDNGNSGYGTACTFQVEYSTAKNFIGISQETVTDAQQVDILLPGGVDTHQSGLGISKIYYLNLNGTLTQTNTGYLAGKALSATELLITGGTA